MTAAIEIEVRNPSGLHARPAAVFVKAAGAVQANVRIANVTTGSAEVSAKSILAVLALGVSRGHRIRLRVEGAVEAGALRTLAELVTAGLGESTSEPLEPSGAIPRPAPELELEPEPEAAGTSEA